jgi:O-antigen ligase
MGEGRLETQSIALRREGYGDARTLIGIHPLYGVGVGNYTAALQALYPYRTGPALEPVHNVFLLLMVEIGLVGISLLGIGTIALLYHHRSHMIALGAFGIALLAIAIFDHYLWSLWHGLAVSAAALVILPSSTSHPPSFHTPS